MGKRNQKRTHQQSTGALDSPEGEVKRLSAKSAAKVLSPQAGESSPGSDLCGDSRDASDPNREWLLDQLKASGVEKPSISFDKRGVWTCRDGRKVLGRLAHSAVVAKDVQAVQALFDLRAAVTLRITGAPWDLLWAIARCMPHVQRAVTLGLLRKEYGDRNPASWSYTRGAAAIEEWKGERRDWAAKAKEQGQKHRALLDSAICVNSGIIVSATKRAYDRFNTWEKTKQREAAPPWAKSIGFDVNEQGIELVRVGKKIMAKISLLGMSGGHRQSQPVVRLSPQGGRAWSVVEHILDGTYKSRSARVVNDGGKWLLKLTYTMPRPIPETGDNTLLVRRGMTRFLSTWCSDGKHAASIDTGSSLVSVKRQMEARRADVRKHLPHQGKGARGHGKARFFRLYEKLDEAESRFVTTWCQQTAALVVREAKRLGCGKILLEDFGQSAPPVSRDPYLQKLLRRFPFAQLRAVITWAATKAGVSVVVQRSDYSVECPQCGDLLHINERGWATCPACDLEADVDTVNAWRLFEAAGVKHSMTEKMEAQRELKRKIEQARRGKKGR